MCTSSYRSQEISTSQQRPWRPWELHNSISKAKSRVAPNSSSKKSSVRCGYSNCHATFKRESEQKRHTRSKHLQKKESCTICNQVFTRKDNLTRHIKLSHNKDQKPFCKFCGKILSRKDAVQRHESTCTKNPQKPSKPNTKVEEETYLTHRERLLMKHQKSQLSSSTNLKVNDHE